jgi:hypothetical protein
VPKPVATLERAAAAVGLPDGSIGTDVGYVSQFLVDARLRALHRHVHGALERPEVGREGEMLLRIQLLLWKYQNRISRERRANQFQGRSRRIVAQIDVADFRSEFSRERIDGKVVTQGSRPTTENAALKGRRP